ncbi:hypothetical protein CRUP_033823 [Coryphaenoides rupestris]|nr:hypothetical protein CRUP_033823 [Coryphaenoides rupestris]
MRVYPGRACSAPSRSVNSLLSTRPHRNTLNDTKTQLAGALPRGSRAGIEVIYEDLQYLSVSALALAGLAGLLMLSMWLLDRAYRRIKACRRHRHRPRKPRERTAQRPIRLDGWADVLFIT